MVFFCPHLVLFDNQDMASDMLKPLRSNQGDGPGGQPLLAERDHGVRHHLGWEDVHDRGHQG